MQGLRDFGSALIVALLSIGLMFGVLSISLVEFQSEASATASNTLPLSPPPITSTSTFLPTATALAGIESPTLTASLTPTSVVRQSSCPPPAGWGEIVVKSGESITSLAARYGIAREQLTSANCLVTDSLVSGTTLYVPLTFTSTVAVCNPGAVGWVRSYVVQPGDTLYAIATNHYTSQTLIINVNCRLGTLIYSGEVLWVPNVATRTPIPSPLPGSTITKYPTEPLTETALPFTVTFMPTDTVTPTVIPTFTPAPTLTPSPTAIH